MITTPQAIKFGHKASFCTDNRGMSTVEYVIILVLIAAAAIGAWSVFGQSVRGKLKVAVGQMQHVNVEKK